jgi:hypothetical protein
MRSVECDSYIAIPEYFTHVQAKLSRQTKRVYPFQTLSTDNRKYTGVYELQENSPGQADAISKKDLILSTYTRAPLDIP